MATKKDFDKFLYYIIFRWEGGGKLHNVTGDSGGWTKYGIAQTRNPDIDVKNLTWEKAKAVYLERYWNPLKPENWHPSIALISLDAAINQGVGDAKEFLQAAGRTLTDGIIGTNTIRSVNGRDRLDYLEDYAAYRGEDYMQNSRYQLNRFGLGWQRRLINIYTVSYRIHAGMDVDADEFSGIPTT